MNSGQQLLTIGALLLLTILSLTVFRSTGQRSTSNYENEAILTGTSIGQSILEEIESRAFDENTIASTAKSPADLSATLGKDSGETSVYTFDDIDDYNNYTNSDTLDRMGVFNIKVSVYYVQNMNPGVKSIARTFSKRIDIAVTNKNIPDTLKFNYVAAY